MKIGLLFCATWIGLQLGSTARVLAEDPFRLGLPQFEQDLNLLSSEQAPARIMRPLITSSLVKRGPGGVILDLAQEISFGSSGREALVALRSEASFSNHKPVTLDDLQYSLDRCKDHDGMLARSSVELSHEMNRLVIRYDEGSGPRVLDDLSKCPVVERKSMDIFGQFAGLGSNVVGAGDFSLTDFAAGHSYRLSRRLSRQGGVNEIELRGVSPEQGIAALRVGGLDILFVEDDRIVSKVEADPLLKTSYCLGLRVIFRRSLKFRCDTSIAFDELAYEDA